MRLSFLSRWLAKKPSGSRKSPWLRARSLQVEPLEDRLLPSGNPLLLGDDFGDTFEAAQNIPLDPTGAVAQAGSLHSAGDVDLFRFIAPVTGTMQIQAFGLDAVVRVFNSDHQQIGSDALPFPVSADQAYFVEVSNPPLAIPFAPIEGPSQSVGLYQLILAPFQDDHGSTFETATPLVLTNSGIVTLSGNIEAQSDLDVFRFVATSTGFLSINLAFTHFSAAVLTVYNGDQQPIATGSPFAMGNHVTIFATAGQVYYLDAHGTSSAAYTISVGPVALSPALMPSGNPPAIAQLVTFILPDLSIRSALEIGNAVESSEKPRFVDRHSFASPGVPSLPTQPFGATTRPRIVAGESLLGEESTPVLDIRYELWFGGRDNASVPVEIPLDALLGLDVAAPTDLAGYLLVGKPVGKLLAQKNSGVGPVAALLSRSEGTEAQPGNGGEANEARSTRRMIGLNYAPARRAATSPAQPSGRKDVLPLPPSGPSSAVFAGDVPGDHATELVVFEEALEPQPSGADDTDLEAYFQEGSTSAWLGLAATLLSACQIYAMVRGTKPSHHHPSPEVDETPFAKPEKWMAG